MKIFIFLIVDVSIGALNFFYLVYTNAFNGLFITLDNT